MSPIYKPPVFCIFVIVACCQWNCRVIKEKTAKEVGVCNVVLNEFLIITEFETKMQETKLIIRESSIKKV